MTEDTLNPSVTDTDAAAKRAQIELGATERGIKFDKRFSDKRLSDMIAEHDAKLAAPTAATLAPPAPIKAAEPVEDVAALKARLAAAEAALAATKEPITTNMTTSMKISLPGDIEREEAEKRMLMERCMQVGIAHLIPPRANPDSIRDILGRHMAEKAQKAAAEEATARIRARGAQEKFVTMRVLPLGDNKISRGIHVPGFGDEMYERGDIIENVPLSTAQAHQANGMGEIIS